MKSILIICKAKDLSKAIHKAMGKDNEKTKK